jgi:hypothetical protein
MVPLSQLGSPREGHDLLFRFHGILPKKQERESVAVTQDRERAGERKAAPG